MFWNRPPQVERIRMQAVILAMEHLGRGANAQDIIAEACEYEQYLQLGRDGFPPTFHVDPPEAPE